MAQVSDKMKIIIVIVVLAIAAVLAVQFTVGWGFLGGGETTRVEGTTDGVPDVVRDNERRQGLDPDRERPRTSVPDSFQEDAEDEGGGG